ncbi:MAG: hypothetical protein ETSY1_33230 [Candidatus Entotheonella factor]|uniref:PqqD family protein n=1 Tax=Entotheonella factor TaxID=1429438 RepID=W4LBZ3_ENTF1|nr:MAG: hypothetical protein ETSY1_33230 [Candidatus Entotheonella factor]
MLPICPKTRRPETDLNIIAVEVSGEYVIYDMNNNHVHELNATATGVWQGCDGHTPCDILIARLAHQHGLAQEQADLLFWLAIDRLERAGLLEAKVESPSNGQRMTRRAVLAQVGVAALLPVVHTIIAPEPAQAQSGQATTVTYYSGAGCTGSSFTFDIVDLGGAPLSICCTPDAATDDPCGEGQNVLSYQTDTGSCTSC